MSCYVDPNFDTYSLDACARYGILANDPCLFLTGKPSPYIPAYMPSFPMKPDSFYPSVNYAAIRNKPNWKKIAFGVIASALAVTFAVKCPKMAKKLVPSNIKGFFVNNTPRVVKNGYSSVCKYAGKACKAIGKQCSAFKNWWQKLCK